MFPFNPLIIPVLGIALLIGAAFGVHEALSVMPAWKVFLVVAGGFLALVAFALWGGHQMEFGRVPRYVVRNRTGRLMRETNYMFVAWFVWRSHRADGATAHDRTSGVETAWMQAGDKWADHEERARMAKSAEEAATLAQAVIARASRK